VDRVFHPRRIPRCFARLFPCAIGGCGARWVAGGLFFLDGAVEDHSRNTHRMGEHPITFFNARCVVCALLDDLDLIEDMFSRLNEAVPLNAAEKRNAIGGRLVKAITETSLHPFFTKKVKFGNKRYQHKEASARFLLLEEKIRGIGDIVDTKKVYLDALAEEYHSEGRKRVTELKDAVVQVLDAMSAEFVEKDELLQAQGILTVYYLLFRTALETGDQHKITRRKLLNFRQKVAQNREEAALNYAQTIWDFIDGKFTLAEDFEYQRDNSIDLASLGYSDIAKQYPKIRVMFDSFVLPVGGLQAHGAQARKNAIERAEQLRPVFDELAGRSVPRSPRCSRMYHYLLMPDSPARVLRGFGLVLSPDARL
jgi:hypothetical protein